MADILQLDPFTCCGPQRLVVILKEEVELVIFLLFTFFLCPWLSVEVAKAGTHIGGSFRDFHVYIWSCYDDGQNMSIFDRHPNSMSLVFCPEALCTQAWIQMNLMAVFNEDIFTAVGHDSFTDI